VQRHSPPSALVGSGASLASASLRARIRFLHFRARPRSSYAGDGNLAISRRNRVPRRRRSCHPLAPTSMTNRKPARSMAALERHATSMPSERRREERASAAASSRSAPRRMCSNAAASTARFHAAHRAASRSIMSSLTMTASGAAADEPRVLRDEKSSGQSVLEPCPRHLRPGGCPSQCGRRRAEPR